MTRWARAAASCGAGWLSAPSLLRLLCGALCGFVLGARLGEQRCGECLLVRGEPGLRDAAARGVWEDAAARGVWEATAPVAPCGAVTSPLKRAPDTAAQPDAAAPFARPPVASAPLAPPLVAAAPLARPPKAAAPHARPPDAAAPLARPPDAAAPLARQPDVVAPLARDEPPAPPAASCPALRGLLARCGCGWRRGELPLRGLPGGGLVRPAASLRGAVRGEDRRG